MIYKLVENVEEGLNFNILEKDTIDYSRNIVKKPWGYEYLVLENEHVAVWMLHVVRTRKTSMHCHPHKKTSLILLSGEAKVHHGDGDIDLKAMDGVIIGKGIFHMTEAFSQLPVSPQSENGIWVMEIETPPSKNDLVRKNDDYGRKGRGYEGEGQFVREPSYLLDFEKEEMESNIQKKFFDCRISIKQGDFRDESFQPNAMVSVIGSTQKNELINPFLSMGGLSKVEEFKEGTKGEDISSYTFLILEKELQTVRVADYIFSTIADLGVRQVFSVSGGGAMHLVDAVGKEERLEYIATHHEQAAAMAAEAYARAAKGYGCALFTTGPGGTNSLTGVCGAWVDSIPVVYISGQVTRNALLGKTGLRQLGIQESDITTLVSSVTKYAVTVTDPKTIRYHLEKAICIANSGRPGPVWLDIPLDVQSVLINPKELKGFEPEANQSNIQKGLKQKVVQCIEMLKEAQRPVLICGYGIRLAHGEKEFLTLVNNLKIPVVSSWTSSDLIPSDHTYYIGRSGIMGDRPANFSVQNADLLLTIGTRMSVPQVGYNAKTFSRESKRIVVDIDPVETSKEILRTDLAINHDAKEFMLEMLRQLDGHEGFERTDWNARTKNWKEKYPVVLPEYKDNKDKVNSFYFVDQLSRKLDETAVVVTDMGTSFTCTMQTFHIKSGQRLFTSSGHAPMGFGLPGAIGACYGNGKKKTICISGDGGLQMNIQELQTVAHNKLPIILFVINNEGYLTIKLMQQNHFGRYVGSESSSGVTTPDMIKIADAYGIESMRISNQTQLDEKLDSVLAKAGPFICEIMMPPEQPLIPRVSSFKKPDGTITAKPLEDLYPFLDRKEFLENMIVKPIEPLR